jgi:cytoskeletal protein RodZ
MANDQIRRLVMGIGELLRSEREKRGLSLSDVEDAIKIRTRYIHALETEKFDIIPGEIYRLGFLKNYARLLGLDSEDIVARYKSDYKSTDWDTDHQSGVRQAFASARSSVPDADQTGEQQADATARRPVRDWMGKFTSARRPLLGAVVLVVLLLLITVAVISARNVHLGFSAQQPQAQKPQATTPSVYSQPTTLEIGLVAIGHSWTEVKVDGVDEYEGLLNPGDTKTFTAQSTVWMRLGYPRGVDIYYNGKLLPPMNTGKPESREFTKGMGALTD